MAVSTTPQPVHVVLQYPEPDMGLLYAELVLFLILAVVMGSIVLYINCIANATRNDKTLHNATAHGATAHGTTAHNATAHGTTAHGATAHKTLYNAKAHNATAHNKTLYNATAHDATAHNKALHDTAPRREESKHAPAQQPCAEQHVETTR
jgi:hypothetical protein